MSYHNGSLQVHGTGISGYAGQPNIYINISVSDVTRSGNTISATVDASLNGVGGYDYFGYNADISVQLDDGITKSLISKPNSPSQWNSGVYSGSTSVSSVNSSTSCTLKIYFASVCGQLDGDPGCSESPHSHVVQTISMSAPAANVTVTFDLDGGTRTGGGQLTQSVAIGGTVTAPTCTRTQCNFVQWDKPLTNIQSSQTITAIWDYIIIYNTSQLYYITLENQIKHKNQTLVLSDIDLSSENPGHTHTGWATSSGGAAVYDLGGNYTANAPATLYPAWDASRQTFTVKFDLRGGSSSGGGALTQTIQYGHSATPPNNPTKSGKRFVGWLGDYTNITSDRTIYALWDSSPLWIFTGSTWIPFSS